MTWQQFKKGYSHKVINECESFYCVGVTEANNSFKGLGRMGFTPPQSSHYTRRVDHDLRREPRTKRPLTSYAHTGHRTACCEYLREQSLFVVFAVCVCDVCTVCLWCICGVLVVYLLWCVCGVFVVCLWCVCGVFVGVCGVGGMLVVCL
jgi:hypothetical protein